LLFPLRGGIKIRGGVEVLLPPCLKQLSGFWKSVELCSETAKYFLMYSDVEVGHILFKDLIFMIFWR